MAQQLDFEPPHRIKQRLEALDPSYRTTPLHDLPELAQSLGISAIFSKEEGARTLGSFKSLGGTYAALRALSRSSGLDFETIAGGDAQQENLPALLTASAGNHGLAVAAAARFAGSRARIFLYPGVSEARRHRIVEMGAAIVDIDGSYDDAVAAAKAAADVGGGILVADTSDDPLDPIVGDVMSGYSVLPFEIIGQIGDAPRLTHLFIQTGVGGLAAAMTAGLHGFLEAPARVVVVEPGRAASVELALKNSRVERFPGLLDTAATMLACGEASGPALKALSGAVDVVTVSEDVLIETAGRLRRFGGPATTASGAAGLAGLVAALDDPATATRLELGPSSRVLIVVTEGPLNEESKGE